MFPRRFRRRRIGVTSGSIFSWWIGRTIHPHRLAFRRSVALQGEFLRETVIYGGPGTASRPARHGASNFETTESLMSSFPGSPRLIKGAIIGLDPTNPLASVVVFQYNPDTMTRRLEARSTGGTDTSDRSEAFRLTGPPKETITLNIEVDATDQLEQANPIAIASGVSPTLAALELLLYPKSSTVIANVALAQIGNIEIIPPEAPLTLFVWGPARVLPVRVSGFSITEEAYDPLLNPIRAKVDLTLNVLSYVDLKITNPGYTLFMAHQIAKEVLATTNVVNSALNLTASVKFP